jgi:2-polyprenyl-6-methoxyphenol hydroxylase-like FAD-dependent oxidoreductase
MDPALPASKSGQPPQRCAIVGGGPAGMMTGYLLARLGVPVTVFEKHGDFLRDFRGDTIHPSTLDALGELGLLDAFLRRPHQEIQQFTATFGDREIPIADFSHLPTRCRFLAFMPQWDFLDLIADEARRLPSFQLRMNTEVTGLIVRNTSVAGVIARHEGQAAKFPADLVIGCDGRGSTVRAEAGFEIQDLGAPMDVFWMRLPRRASDGEQAFGRFTAGKALVMINRGGYWQCGFLLPKGTGEEIKARGLDAFYQDIIDCAPFMADRTATLNSWDQVKLLTVRVDRLRRWHRRGLLCIGDAAHAMSPVGGIGINLAIQDAIATANLLGRPLLAGTAGESDLAGVQRRREWPTRATQCIQVIIQNKIVRPVLAATGSLQPPWPLRMMEKLPFLRRLPGRFIGLGFRPEHVAPFLREASAPAPKLQSVS